MAGLHYQRGPDDHPAEVDRWQCLDHQASTGAFGVALLLTIAGSVILIAGMMIGRGAVTYVVLQVGWLVQMVAILASVFAALCGWSANRYSRGSLPGGPMWAALGLAAFAATVLMCSCAYARWWL